VGLTPPPHLVPKVIEKSRAIRLLTQRARVAYKKGENLPTILLFHVRTYTKGTQIFKRCVSHLKILCAGSATGRQLHASAQQIFNYQIY